MTADRTNKTLFIIESAHMVLIVLVPLYVGLALDMPDVAFVATVASMILYMIDIAAGKRGDPKVTFAATVVLFVSALLANLLSGNLLMVSVYVLALIFFGGMGILYGRFWAAVGMFVPIALVIIAFAIGEDATLQAAVVGLLTGSVWAILLAVVFRFIRPKASTSSEALPTFTEEVRRDIILFSARRTVAVALAVLIALVGATEKPYWVMLTILIVLQPLSKGSMQRAVQYGLGTAGGVVLSLMAALLFEVSEDFTAVILVLLVVGIVYAFTIDYGLQTVLTTTLVLILLTIVYPEEGWFFGERLLDAMAGIGIAMVVEHSQVLPGSKRIREGEGS